jgi:hypothetical protein
MENEYSVTYRNILPETLDGFTVVFLSYSNWQSQGTVMDDRMANVIIDYLEHGGYVYLEGADVFGYDQPDNAQLLELFGLASASDGYENPVDGLSGQPDALTNELLFNGNSQSSNFYIDKYESGPDAIAAFIESDYGTVAVQNIGTEGQRTFCFSYALADLADGEFPSTRAELLERILNFFDIYTAVPVIEEAPAISCKVYPNPVSSVATIQYNLQEDSHVNLELFNSTGQSILQPVNGKQMEGVYSVQWNARGLPAGIYYYSLREEKQVSTGKIVVLY